jgi:hypothetical protein
MVPQYMPLMRKVVDYVAATFHRPALLKLRTRDGEALPEDHVQTRRLRRMEIETQLHPALRQWQRRAEGGGTAFLFPVARWGRMSWEVLTPDVVWAWEDERAPGDVQRCEWVAHELSRPMISTNRAREADARRFVVWTRNEVKIVDRWGRPVADPGLGATVEGTLVSGNPYGLIPYAVLHRDPHTAGMWGPIPESYVTSQVGINLLWSDFHLQMRLVAGLGVANLVDTAKFPERLKYGIDRILKLGPDDKFDFRGPALPIEGMLSFAQKYVQTYAVMRGLQPDVFSIDGEAFSTAISAVAKEIDRVDVQEMREEKEPDLRTRIVYDVWPIGRAVWNVSHPEHRIDHDLDLDVEFPEPKRVVSALEDAQARQARINSGMSDPVEELMAAKPGRTEAEAEALFEKHLARAARLRDALGGGRQTVGAPGSSGPSGVAE